MILKNQSVWQDISNISGCVGYWKLDGNSNDSVNDNNGIDTNVIYDSSGRVRSCGVFNGSANISIPYSSEFDVASALTISAWIKLGTNTAFNRIVAKSHIAAVYPYTLYGLVRTGGTYHPTESTGNIRTELTQGGKQHIVHTTSKPPIGEWVNIVATYNGSTGEANMYYNGLLETSGQQIWQYNGIGTSGVYVTMSGVLDTNSMPITIGWDGLSPKANYLTGSIDEVVLFNRELIQNEITQLYNSGYPKFTTLNKENNNFNIKKQDSQFTLINCSKLEILRSQYNNLIIREVK